MTRIFHYTARSHEGHFVSGTFAADSHDAALTYLRARTLFITSLEFAGTPRAAFASVLSLIPIDRSARVAFFRSFATLIRSGVSMRRAFEVTIRQCRDRRLAEALRSIASEIEGGSTLSAALARRPRDFSSLWVAMVHAGEIAGALDEVLERLAHMLERDRALRKRVGAAMTYPLVVVTAAIGLVLFLIANTVPAFAAMFTQMHLALPLSTRVLIALGVMLHHPFGWAALVLLPIAGFGTLRLIERSEDWHGRIEHLRMVIPVFGTLRRKTALARCARTLGTLLRSGIALLTAIDVCEEVLDQRLYRVSLRECRAALAAGDPLGVPLAHSGLFDPLFVQLVHVGEETGTLDAMLLRLAEYYELDVETAVTALSSVIEPVLVVVLGAVVGTIVASILLPLYSIIGSIT